MLNFIPLSSGNRTGQIKLAFVRLWVGFYETVVWYPNCSMFKQGRSGNGDRVNLVRSSV